MHFLINAASICPFLLILLSVIQSITFISSARSALKGESETAFSAYNTLSKDEYAVLFKIHGIDKIVIIPLFVIFIFFFSSFLKILIPILIYILSFLVSKIIFLILCNKQKRNN